MKSKMSLIFLVVFCFSLSAFSQDAGELISKADKLYLEMKDMATANEALDDYKKALESAADKYEAYWKISRILYFIGFHTESKKEKKVIFAQGIDYATKAIGLEPEKSDGHYWLGVNNGKYGEAKGILKSLALVKPIKRSMNKVIELDHSYEDGGPDRVLGRVFFKVPGFAGGSKKKSLEHLLKSKELGPEDALTRIYLADTFLSLKEVEKARQELEYVLSMEPDPKWVSGVDECKVEAKQLLEKKKFKTS
ncbi:tetratricopeptide repeat protein [Acidobacteriota bacterium]